MGIAALAVSTGGVLTAAHPGLAGTTNAQSVNVVAANALTGVSGTSRNSQLAARQEAVSRDSSRTEQTEEADAEAVDEAEAQADERTAALAKVDTQADQQEKKIELNQWVLPLTEYRLTARFGDYGLWASAHTGLDFAAPSGTPIYAVANGTVTETGYDGAYGNKTVITLDDGTDLWFCHQTSWTVDEGDIVRAGDLIGYVGSTGNTTGPHLHLEVRPGGGDPVDPYAALVENRLDP
jgi:murein DD-endopeptidase MepM/ murein hydrolase activator NlpD